MKMFLYIIVLLFIGFNSKIKGATLSIDFVSSWYTKISSDYPEIADIAEFQFEFNVTAFGDDVYFSGRSLIFSSVNDNRIAFTDISSSSNRSGQFFQIPEGSTERVWVNFLIDPNSDGYHSMKLDELRFGSSISSPTEFGVNFGPEFESKSVYLRTNQIPEPSPVMISATLLILAITRRDRRFKRNF